jgi:hypothetical protein
MTAGRWFSGLLTSERRRQDLDANVRQRRFTTNQNKDLSWLRPCQNIFLNRYDLPIRYRMVHK